MMPALNDGHPSLPRQRQSQQQLHNKGSNIVNQSQLPQPQLQVLREKSGLQSTTTYFLEDETGHIYHDM